MQSKLLAAFRSLYVLGLSLPLIFTRMNFFPSSPHNNQLREDFQQHNPTTTPKKPRRAVAMFVDSPTYMYGVFSVKTQLQKFDMNIEQVAVIPDDFASQYPTEYSVLQEWLGDDHIQAVNKKFLHDKLDASVWKGTFNKLWLFALTEYDQLIVLDSDVLIRKSLLHWFDYPMPAGIQTPDDPMTWNSGAMVIQPNAAVFDQMLQVLPQMRAYNATSEKDTFTPSSNTDQDFLSAFFTHPNTTQRFHTLPSYASVISSKLKQNRYKYWVQTSRKQELLETVHFTSVKPWKKFATNEPILCDFLREWKESVKGIERFEPRLAPLPFDYLRNCPKQQEQVEEEAESATRI